MPNPGTVDPGSREFGAVAVVVVDCASAVCMAGPIAAVAPGTLSPEPAGPSDDPV